MTDSETDGPRSTSPDLDGRADLVGDTGSPSDTDRQAEHNPADGDRADAARRVERTFEAAADRPSDPAELSTDGDDVEAAEPAMSEHRRFGDVAYGNAVE